MPYTLKRLAPGSFDLILDGEVVGNLVRDVSTVFSSNRAPVVEF